MIPFRYHLVSVAALFLALALGVVLGSTSLSERLLATVSDERSSLQQQATELREENKSLRDELAGAGRYGDVVGPMAVRGRLNERSVVVISSADVSEQERGAMRNSLERAGATVTGEVRMTDRIADPEQVDELRRTVTGLLPAGVQLPATADPGTLLGGLLGPLALRDPETRQSQVSPPERVSAVRGLADGGFVQLPDGIEPAQLAVVLTGGQADGEDPGSSASTVARLAAQVDASGAGAVLAGSTGSAAGNGPVGMVRTDRATADGLSTVDNADTVFGRVSVVLALAEQWERRSGHYGLADNAQDVVPGSRE